MLLLAASLRPHTVLKQTIYYLTNQTPLPNTTQICSFSANCHRIDAARTQLTV